MPEETHVLQVKIQRAAEGLSLALKRRCAVTLIAFYRQVLAMGWGFASALPDHESVILTLEATVARQCGAPLPPRDPGVWLPDTELVKQLAEQARDGLPFSCGFILILGAGVDSAYASFEESPPMVEFMSHIVLPALRAQQAVTPIEVTDA